VEKPEQDLKQPGRKRYWLVGVIISDRQKKVAHVNYKSDLLRLISNPDMTVISFRKVNPGSKLIH
jgi:uncharacterized DUF497 family protein